MFLVEKLISRIEALKEKNPKKHKAIISTVPPVAPAAATEPGVVLKRSDTFFGRHQNMTREFLEDISHGCCPAHHYCTLKEILIRLPSNQRTLLQIKCIEKLKYERSVADKRGYDWDEAIDIWIDEGYAERFSDLYRDGIRLAELYPALLKGKESAKAS